MQKAIIKDTRPLTRFARQALSEPGQPAMVLEGRLAVMQERIAMFVARSMSAEFYAETHTEAKTTVEFVRRCELVEHHAAEISGDNRTVIDRAIDHVGEHIPHIVASCSARNPNGKCPPLHTENQSWASHFDTTI